MALAKITIFKDFKQFASERAEDLIENTINNDVPEMLDLYAKQIAIIDKTRTIEKTYIPEETCKQYYNLIEEYGKLESEQEYLTYTFLYESGFREGFEFAKALCKDNKKEIEEDL